MQRSADLHLAISIAGSVRPLMPGVAFEVDDLRKAIEGKEVIMEPNSPSKGVTVAFILEDGAPVELLELS